MLLTLNTGLSRYWLNISCIKLHFIFHISKVILSKKPVMLDIFCLYKQTNGGLFKITNWTHESRSVQHSASPSPSPYSLNSPSDNSFCTLSFSPLLLALSPPESSGSVWLSAWRSMSLCPYFSSFWRELKYKHNKIWISRHHHNTFSDLATTLFMIVSGAKMNKIKQTL